MAGLRTVGVKLAAEVSGYVNNLRTAKGSTQDFVGELSKAAKSGHLDAVADQGVRMGLGLAGAFAVAVGAAAKFDKQMSEVSAVANASAADMDRLRQAALQAGKDTAFSATEAAKAEAELAKAGLTSSDILGGALSGSLSLAAAGSLDLAESADIAAKTMNVFQLEGQDVGHIADVLAAAANKSATDVHEMGEALKMGGLAASAAGMSMEETVGTLAAFADRALVGSDAGTSLKTALMMLQAPSKKAQETMNELGISAYDASGNFIGTAKLAGVLQQALGGLTQEQRNAALATIFGADGMRAANILYTIGEKGVRDYTAAVDDQGAAAETAQKKTDNLAGDIERLKGSLETLAIESGSGANGGMRFLTQAVNQLVDGFGQMPPVVGSAVTVVAGLAGAALLAGAGWVKLQTSTAAALDELRKTGPVGTQAAGALEKTSAVAGKVGLAFVALQAAGALVSTFMTDLSPQIDAATQGLEKWSGQGELAGESARLFGKDTEDLSRSLSATANHGFSQFMDGVSDFIFGIGGVASPLDDAKERVKAFDSSLTQMVQSGHADQAGQIVEEMAKRANISVSKMLEVLPQYAGAVETAGSASGKAADGVKAVGEAAGQTAEEVDKLNKEFDGLFKVQMDADEALIAYKKGIIELHDELTKGTRTLDTNTQAGRDNASGVLDQIKNIKELRDARYAHGATLDEVNGKYSTDLEGLRKTLLQLGYNKAAVDELVGAYQEIPESASTVIETPGLPVATQRTNDFNFAIRNVPPSKTVPFWATTTEATAAVNALKAKINELKNKTIYITGSVHWTSSGDLKLPGGTSLKNRWGGLYEHAADGVLRDAHIASPMGDARYAYAEPATGGELFAPKYGDLSRTRAMVDHAVENWWGGKVDWAGRNAAQMPAYTTANAGAITVNVRVDGSVVVEGSGVLRGLQKEVLVRGGNVQQVLGKKQ